MAKNDNLTDFLTGVANAIRTKKGTTAKINPQNFETEIRSITTSKPEQEKTVEATNSLQIIIPDNGKTLSRVIVEAAPLPHEYNGEYKNINKCLINKKNKTLILGCNKSIIPLDGSVTSIGNSAFYYCSDLTSVTIPDSVTSIGNEAFKACYGLTSLAIPNSVTSIGSAAFENCRFTNITIPDSVISIGSFAFEGCSRLASIIMLPTTPPTLGSNAIPSNVTTITVPVGCGDAYKTAAGWSAYANKIVEATA